MQSAIKLGVSFLCVLKLPKPPETVAPMLDKMLKIGWVILFLYAFIVTISGMRRTKQYFLIVNLFLMVFICTTVWLNWLLYLDTRTTGLGDGFFWGELVLEGWLFLLLFFGLSFAKRLHTALKHIFLLAVFCLIGYQLLHSWNIMYSHYHFFWTFIVERMFILSFVASMVVAAFRYSAEMLGDSNTLPVQMHNKSVMIHNEAK
jgi:hypothetical protein